MTVFLTPLAFLPHSSGCCGAKLLLPTGWKPPLSAWFRFYLELDKLKELSVEIGWRLYGEDTPDEDALVKRKVFEIIQEDSGFGIVRPFFGGPEIENQGAGVLSISYKMIPGLSLFDGAVYYYLT
jgi:hypothetical protein